VQPCSTKKLRIPNYKFKNNKTKGKQILLPFCFGFMFRVLAACILLLVVGLRRATFGLSSSLRQPGRAQPPLTSEPLNVELWNLKNEKRERTLRRLPFDFCAIF
jgi:hypothetical protein